MLSGSRRCLLHDNECMIYVSEFAAAFDFTYCIGRRSMLCRRDENVEGASTESAHILWYDMMYSCTRSCDVRFAGPPRQQSGMIL